MKQFKKLLYAIGVAVLLTSCVAEGNDPGDEFMPDMFHSIAYEANSYSDYKNNVWDEESSVDRYTLSQPREPAPNTVNRGFQGMTAARDIGRLQRHMTGQESVMGIRISPGGKVYYPYTDSEQDRERAIEEITENPFPISDADLGYAKDLYNVYCGICHGEKGDGDGYLVREGGAYPAQPANLLTDDLTNTSNGQIYHAIMVGRNLMGSYADKLNYRERWMVVHYIRSLQAADRGLVYSERENTLNEVDVPLADYEGEYSPLYDIQREFTDDIQVEEPPSTSTDELEEPEDTFGEEEYELDERLDDE